MKKRHSIAALFLLAACASTPVYGPQNGPNGFGYNEQKIEEGRFRISYVGRDFIEASNGALRRAAELTKNTGHDYFTVTMSDEEQSQRRRGASPSIGIGGSTGSRGGSNVGVGISLPIGSSYKERYESRLEVVLGRGEKPEGPNHYSADSVLENIPN